MVKLLKFWITTKLEETISVTLVVRGKNVKKDALLNLT